MDQLTRRDGKFGFLEGDGEAGKLTLRDRHAKQSDRTRAEDSDDLASLDFCKVGHRVDPNRQRLNHRAILEGHLWTSVEGESQPSWRER